MGLLEKAQERKQELIQEEKNLTPKKNKASEEIKDDKKGLLEKSKQKKQHIPTKIEEKKEPIIKIKNKEIIEEKKGFGYKGIGVRKIILDKDSKEYFYFVDEPELSDFEIEVKKELSHLFKMLADVNVTVTDKKEKEEFLEKTLDKIVVDNNIKFIGKTRKEKEEEKNRQKENKGKFPKLFEKKKPNSNIKKKTSNKKPLSLFSKNSKKGKTAKEDQVLNVEELSPEEKKARENIYYHIFQDFIGFGKIDIIMEDEGIEDISCDGHHVPVFIYHKKYDEITSNVQFEDEQELNSFVVRLAQISGKQISIYSPIVDGKLPDGSRLQTTLARTVTRGSTFTIRKFKENPLTPIDLIGFQSLSIEMAAYFWMAIERGSSILFCGGTASGKTTALNALSLFIPAQHKIVSIEDTREVNLPHKNWIAGTTREGFSSADNKTGKDIDMFDLIRAALRQRPKVVMVGEVRGKEAYSLFQAMSTGHTSYATVHASDIHTLIQRLENPPISLPRALLTSLDLIVFQNAIDIKGKTVRRMTSVTEIVKLDPDTNQLIFMEPYKWVSKTDDRFEVSGSSKILNKIRLQNDWTESQLEKEIQNRKLILRWMLEKNIRDYKEVGRIVNQYTRHPDELLKKAREELKA